MHLINVKMCKYENVIMFVRLNAFRTGAKVGRMEKCGNLKIGECGNAE
ncbi:hypothetical protein NIASO_01220 [Niabella soli DSM 19437]|uniref:Uncharacterized protein n=1 Tax=Niabella soli DSM 19437 TaxID=929713 RepID=W0F5H0_9BACT|nr:hypothetical protein NIASO_01220 [Niabella soli DSM 19437]